MANRRVGRPLPRSSNVDSSRRSVSPPSTPESSLSGDLQPAPRASQSQAASFSATRLSESFRNNISLEDDEAVAPELRLIEKLTRHLDREIGATAEECEEAGISIAELDEAYKRLHVMRRAFGERKAIFDGTSLDIEEATRQLRSVTEQDIRQVRWPLLTDYVNFRQNLWVHLLALELLLPGR